MMFKHGPAEGQPEGFPSGFRKCTSCSAIAHPGDDFCASCGERLQPPPSDPRERCCPACGLIVRNRIAFHCIRCGTALPRVQQR
ncbi:MAG TPA: zinc ribbon domain-containing protein [Candidatus Kapabacteria bacterium]|nr:zinc ribbon domain-containing protein [Candidatus Kapabacteria bacterium]